MGQNGDYVIWNEIGDPFGSFSTDAILNDQLNTIVQKHTGRCVVFYDAAPGTDTLPFIQTGVPATSFASLDSMLGFGGLHRPADNIGRVAMEKLPETSYIMTNFVKHTDCFDGDCQD